MHLPSVSTVLVLALAAHAEAVAEALPYLVAMSPAAMGLARRDTNGYSPIATHCGAGDTCAQACGAGYTGCPSTDNQNHCFNPTAGQNCCANGKGDSCDSGFYCTGDSTGNTVCCPSSLDLGNCAQALKVTGALTSVPTAGTPSTPSSSPNPSATPSPPPTTTSTPEATTTSTTAEATTTSTTAEASSSSSPSTSTSTVTSTSVVSAGLSTTTTLATVVETSTVCSASVSSSVLVGYNNSQPLSSYAPSAIPTFIGSTVVLTSSTPAAIATTVPSAGAAANGAAVLLVLGIFAIVL